LRLYVQKPAVRCLFQNLDSTNKLKDKPQRHAGAEYFFVCPGL